MKNASHIVIKSQFFGLGSEFLSKISATCKMKKKVTIEVGTPEQSIYNQSKVLAEGTFFTVEYTKEYFNTIFNTAHHDSFTDKFLGFFMPLFEIGVKYQESVPESKGNMIYMYLKMDLGNVIMNFMVPTFPQKETYGDCIKAAFLYASDYLQSSPRSALKKEVSKTFKVSGSKDIFIMYEVAKQKWKILDVLRLAVNETHTYYMNKIDKRSSKPTIYFNEGDLREHLNFANKTVIKTPHQSYFISKPNDVALYSSICEKNVKAAKELGAQLFYRTDTMTTFVHNEPAYYDYFEYIISSITAAYTAVECFVNICIDKNFRYEQKDSNGEVTKIITKTGIEREFSLEKKIKEILPLSLGIKAPTQEKWWKRFTDLEKLRDEVIHSKESKWEHRYTYYLSQDIYEVIETYKILITYYCSELSNSKGEILHKLPYGFGNDQIPPIAVDEDSYIDMWNSFHNAKRPKKTK